MSVVAQKLEDCDFLLNKNFKRSAKVYLCLFSASWCGPCRREMPRISKTYTEMLKDDPDIELIHFSRDQDDAKAKAWAKEHNVKFPVVKPNGGNPLDLHSRGIPHLFIVKADGALLEEGHPMRIFNEEKLLTIREELRRVREAKSAAAGAKSAKEAAKNRTSTQSIIDGMIKVPGKDYWLSETELTQGQWESVMGNNPSKHKGATFPVECVSRNDCDVFLGKLNQTKEVRNSQFVFSLPTEGEWLCATRTKGDILDRAWVLENSSTQTHVVATKAANELGFYDMQGNVWEWLANDKVTKGCRRGGAFSEGKGGCSVHRCIHTPRGRRYSCCGLRLAAHLRPTNNMGETKEGKPTDGQTKIDAARTAVDNIKGAVTTWMISKKRSMPPATLLALVKGDDAEKPVLAGGEKALVDSWGNDIRLEIKGKRFAIISSGPDGKFGTDDDIRSEKDWNAEKDVARQTEGELKRAR